MLITESQLYRNFDRGYRHSDLLLSMPILNEDENFYSPALVPIVEDSKYDLKRIKLEDIIAFSEANNISDLGYSVSLICESSDIDPRDVYFVVEEANVICDKNNMQALVEGMISYNVPVMLTEISDYDPMSILGNFSFNYFLETGDYTFLNSYASGNLGLILEAIDVDAMIKAVENHRAFKGSGDKNVTGGEDKAELKNMLIDKIRKLESEYQEEKKNQGASFTDYNIGGSNMTSFLDHIFANGGNIQNVAPEGQTINDYLKTKFDSTFINDEKDGSGNVVGLSVRNLAKTSAAESRIKKLLAKPASERTKAEWDELERLQSDPNIVGVISRISNSKMESSPFGSIIKGGKGGMNASGKDDNVSDEMERFRKEVSASEDNDALPANFDNSLETAIRTAMNMTDAEDRKDYVERQAKILKRQIAGMPGGGNGATQAAANKMIEKLISIGNSSYDGKDKTFGVKRASAMAFGAKSATLDSNNKITSLDFDGVSNAADATPGTDSSEGTKTVESTVDTANKLKQLSTREQIGRGIAWINKKIRWLRDKVNGTAGSQRNIIQKAIDKLLSIADYLTRKLAAFAHKSQDPGEYAGNQT